MTREFKCPRCGKDDELFETGEIQVMYEIKGIEENGTLNYGDREDLNDSFKPDDYPYYCRHCNRSFDYDDISDIYFKQPV